MTRRLRPYALIAVAVVLALVALAIVALARRLRSSPAS